MLDHFFLIHFSTEGFPPSVHLFPAGWPAHDNFINFAAGKTVGEQLPLGKRQIRLIHGRGFTFRLLVDSSWYWAAVGCHQLRGLFWWS